MIPFQTLGQRHLVYAYCVVWLLQFGYGSWLAVQWRRSRLRTAEVPDAARFRTSHTARKF